ncbi:MAG: PTS fructose transporter subunit IIA [Liquorilactobacillus nagelii]|uniref:PTS sugar transporter subunit IIB n=1 Tax=Liquorilactobacillus nagelii TaxID=82688 RepID=UPI0039ECE669
MKLLLSCSGGMSSSLIAEALEDEAVRRGGKTKVDAVGADEVADYLSGDKYDAVLLAPQAVYLKDSIAAEAQDHQIPFIMIPRTMYSPLGVSKLFDLVEKDLAK